MNVVILGVGVVRLRSPSWEVVGDGLWPSPSPVVVVLAALGRDGLWRVPSPLRGPLRWLFSHHSVSFWLTWTVCVAVVR